jgi:hypothetical protein
MQQDSLFHIKMSHLSDGTFLLLQFSEQDDSTVGAFYLQTVCCKDKDPVNPAGGVRALLFPYQFIGLVPFINGSIRFYCIIQQADKMTVFLKIKAVPAEDGIIGHHGSWFPFAGDRFFVDPPGCRMIFFVTEKKENACPGCYDEQPDDKFVHGYTF